MRRIAVSCIHNIRIGKKKSNNFNLLNSLDIILFVYYTYTILLYTYYNII